MSAVIITGDCREVMPTHGPFDMVFADPPYGDTSLSWDRRVFGWTAVALAALKPSGSMWVFGSMRFLLHLGTPPGFRYAQDIVWEKHNGSGFAADRFKRVHEHAVQFYRADAAWGDVYNDPQRAAYSGPDKSVTPPENRSKHQGQIKAKPYVDDGTRLLRSVLKAPQPRAGNHETPKPLAILEALVRTSCPAGGVVGDLFAGSAALGEACAISGRSYLGCELNPATAESARRRLAETLFSGTAA